MRFEDTQFECLSSFHQNWCRVGGCTFFKLKFWIGYMLPTIWGIYVTWIMYWYWIYHANTGGRNMSLKLYIRIGLMLPTICGVHVSHIYMLILEICCQQFGEYVSVEYIYWYWIYHANTWAMNVSWRVSVWPSGPGVGEGQFRERFFFFGICWPQFWEWFFFFGLWCQPFWGGVLVG